MNSFLLSTHTARLFLNLFPSSPVFIFSFLRSSQYFDRSFQPIGVCACERGVCVWKRKARREREKKKNLSFITLFRNVRRNLNRLSPSPHLLSFKRFVMFNMDVVITGIKTTKKYLTSKLSFSFCWFCVYVSVSEHPGQWSTWPWFCLWVSSFCSLLPWWRRTNNNVCIWQPCVWFKRVNFIRACLTSRQD